MIVRPKPSAWMLFFVLRGSIVPAIAPRLLLVALLSCAAVFVADRYPHAFSAATLAPFTLFGITLSIFLSFRNSASYERWWEARRLWGQLIIELRAFARDCDTLVDDRSLRERLVRRGIAFAHALAARLRCRPVALDAWLDAAERSALSRSRNLPDALLRAQGRDLADLLRRGALAPVLYPIFEQRLTGMLAVQAACERILHTPLPFAYTLLLHRTAMLFCVLLPFGLAGTLGWATPVVSVLLAYTLFGLDALGDELEEPFGLAANDLPLDAMLRSIEIDLLEALGESNLPEPLQPVGYLLT